MSETLPGRLRSEGICSEGTRSRRAVVGDEEYGVVLPARTGPLSIFR